LPTGEKQNALLVPKDALVLGGPTPVVYVVVSGDPSNKHDQVAPVPVKLGVAQGDLIQVTGAVVAGQLVVVQGNERLFPGQAVSVKLLVAETSTAQVPSELTRAP
jgi:hypothetical protein